MRQLEHLLIFIVIRTLYLFFELLPLRVASGLGGWMGRNIGPLLPMTKVAWKNLQLIMPERATDHGKIIRGMWDNFGRVFAEYPHLKTIAAGRGGAQVDVVGAENLEAFRGMGRGGVFISAHLGNWEVGPGLSAAHGVPVHVIYRPPNNPLIDRLLSSARHASGAVSSIMKGSAGARQMIQYLKNKEYMVVLMDQKMNDGISAPFMGKLAMTATSAVQLAIRHQVPICLIRPERIAGIHFRWTVSPPFIPAPDADVVEIITRLNGELSDWVRERPDQWLWIHQRWQKF